MGCISVAGSCSHIREEPDWLYFSWNLRARVTKKGHQVAPAGRLHCVQLWKDVFRSEWVSQGGSHSSQLCRGNAVGMTCAATDWLPLPSSYSCAYFKSQRLDFTKNLQELLPEKKQGIWKIRKSDSRQLSRGAEKQT